MPALGNFWHVQPTGGRKIRGHVMIPIKTIVGIASILLPAATSAFAQTAPSAPGTPTAPGVSSRPAPSTGATRTPDAAMARFQAACKSDIEKYCGTNGSAAKKPAAGAASTPQAPEQIVSCMTTNETKLTAACKTALTERKAATKGNPG
jgi:hypothetical protein